MSWVIGSAIVAHFMSVFAISGWKVVIWWFSDAYEPCRKSTVIKVELWVILCKLQVQHAMYILSFGPKSSIAIYICIANLYIFSKISTINLDFLSSYTTLWNVHKMNIFWARVTLSPASCILHLCARALQNPCNAYQRVSAAASWEGRFSLCYASLGRHFEPTKRKRLLYARSNNP